jgi:hypothetical protein
MQLLIAIKSNATQETHLLDAEVDAPDGKEAGHVLRHEVGVFLQVLVAVLVLGQHAKRLHFRIILLPVSRHLFLIILMAGSIHTTVIVIHIPQRQQRGRLYCWMPC